MAPSRVWRCCVAVAMVAVVVSCQQTGQHTDWPRWCGKVYEPGYPSFDPGGQTLPPPVSDVPLLHVLFQPRFSLYLAGEEYGEFVVNAEFSPYHGTPWPNATSSDPDPDQWANDLIFSINLVDDDEPLVQNSIPVNTTGAVFRFDLSRLTPSLDPIPVVLYGTPEAGTPTWTATTTLSYLPDKPNNGSVTRIDNLAGGLWTRPAPSPSSPSPSFTPFFPYGFYASYDGFLRSPTNNTFLASHYAALGLNAMTPLTDSLSAPQILTYLARNLSLALMYDLRENYKNLTYLSQAVTAALASPALDSALFAYWTADEPDGWQDPFSAPRDAHSLLKHLDPYRPVAVVLNCADYYFGQYSDPEAADILLADVYPVGINATFSKWGTVCNATLGDCGCDDCAGTVTDGARRLDAWREREAWLGRWPRTKLFSPQAFHGEGYWLRDPSVQESWVMVLGAVNHGAKGVVSWVWPASEELGEAHGRLARVVTGSEVVRFLVGGERGPERVVVDGPARAGDKEGVGVVDVACWVDGGRMLVSVVNNGYVDIEGGVEVPVPNATVISSTPWGSVQWTLEGERLSTPLLPALGTSLVILELRG